MELNIIMTSKWIEVEYAIFFLISKCPIILIDNNNTTKIIMLILSPINIIKYTPATTIVDECNKEDTGVGLSIATGNQYLHKYNELLQRTANTIINIINSLFIWNNIIKKTKSLHRLYIIADIALLLPLGRIQYLINNIDITPIPSHPTNISTLDVININTINLKNINITNMKLLFDTSPLM